MGAGDTKAFSSPTLVPFSSSAAGLVDAPCGVHLGSHRPWVFFAANYRAPNANNTNDLLFAFVCDRRWMSSCADFEESVHKAGEKSTILEEPLNEGVLIGTTPGFLIFHSLDSCAQASPSCISCDYPYHLCRHDHRSTSWAVAHFLVGHYDPANPQRQPQSWTLIKHSDNIGKRHQNAYATAVVPVLVNGGLDSDVDDNSKYTPVSHDNTSSALTIITSETVLPFCY